MNKDKRKKYASVYQIINLPRIRNLQLNQQRLFQKLQPSQDQLAFVSPEIQNSRNQLLDKIQQSLTLFDNPSYTFTFPQSKFPQSSNLEYSQRNRQAAQADPAQPEAPLSSDQLSQIKQNGQFTVKNLGQQVNVWKINDCLLKGRVNRVNIWEDGLAWCYSLLVQAKKWVVEEVPEALGKIGRTPIKIFSLFFGRKRVNAIYEENCQREIYKEFWANIIGSQFKNMRKQLGRQFLNRLYLFYQPMLYEQLSKNIPYEKRSNFQKQKSDKISVYQQKKSEIDNFKSLILQTENEFQIQWLKIRKNIFNTVSNLVEQSKQKSMMMESDEIPLSKKVLITKDQGILEKLTEQKFLLYTNYLKENLANKNISKSTIEELLVLILIFSVIQLKIDTKDKKLTMINNKIREEIIKNYSIRSRNSEFLQSKVSQAYQPIEKQFQAEFQENVFKDKRLQKILNEQYFSIYQKYLKLKRNFKNLVEQRKKTAKSFYVSTRFFKSSYIMLAPYQVIKSRDGHYTLKKSVQLSTHTGYYFWKCPLYFMRLKSWSLNCIKFFLRLCWTSPLGLRCLCGTQNFIHDQNINFQTGQKIPQFRQTVLSTFLTVLQGIHQSRQNFQNLPDEGLFGKKCSRICNILQCYLFRFFIVGIIGVLVLYPIAIVLFSCLFFVAMMLFWVYVPIALLLTYLFNVLVYHFESATQPYACYPRVFPLFALVFGLVFYIVKIILVILFLLVIAPLICFLYFLLLILQRGLRTLTDAIMVCLIGCLGRTPRRDTNIATRISGPGITSSHYYAISQEDVYILVQGALQKIFGQKFIQLTRQKIAQVQNRYQKITSYVLKPFGVFTPNLAYQKQIIKKNVQEVTSNFSIQSEKFLKRFPQNPNNIRFTQQQLQLYLENSQKIVKNFVEKNKIQGWIFEEKGIIQQDYEQLTRIIWTQIFRCGSQIFQPLEDIQNRFQLIDQSNTNQQIMKKNIDFVMKAIQGQVSLSKSVQRVTPGKTSLLQKDNKFQFISKILKIHENNSEISINFSFSDPSFLFIPHRNLPQLTIYDLYQEEQASLREKQNFQ